MIFTVALADLGVRRQPQPNGGDPDRLPQARSAVRRRLRSTNGTVRNYGNYLRGVCPVPGLPAYPQSLAVTDLQAAMRECAFSYEPRSIREHNHFAIDDLILGKKLLTGFRIDRDFRVRKALLDRPESLSLVGNGDEDELVAQCTTGASAGPHRANFP